MNNLNKITRCLWGAKPINAFNNAFIKRDLARSLWCMNGNHKQSPHLKVKNAQVLGIGGGNVCAPKFVHTKGERELVEFLTEEILAERKSQKTKGVLNSIEDFNASYDGADVTLCRKSEKENVLISFNVNHTVDTEENHDMNPNANKESMMEMRSRPPFKVDIVRGNTTLLFSCSFLEGAPEEGEYNDIFGIDAFSIYDNEWDDKVYAVAGDVLDGYLYDLLMNILEEKGITNEFVEKLADLATAYEHASYIELLEKLSKFTFGK